MAPQTCIGTARVFEALVYLKLTHTACLMSLQRFQNLELTSQYGRSLAIDSCAEIERPLKTRFFQFVCVSKNIRFAKVVVSV
jgi:hypothetical protein